MAFTTGKPELKPCGKEADQIVIYFKAERETQNKIRFDEELPEVSLSEHDIASGAFYIYKETLEALGNPSRIKITIEPAPKSKKGS